MEKEHPDHVKKALFEVEIVTEQTQVTAKDLSFDAAYAIVKGIVEGNPDHKELQEAWQMCSAPGSFGFVGTSHGKFKFHVSAYLPSKPMEGAEEFLCPRRAEGVPAFMEGKKDHWQMRGDDPCCSYCGSMKPSRVIELVKQHGFGIMQRTDKGYKWYVHRQGVPNASFGGIKTYMQHWSDADIKEYNAMLPTPPTASTQEEAAPQP